MLVVRHESTSNSGAAPNDSTVRSGASQGQDALSVSASAPYLAHMLQRKPCLPTKTDKLPSGDLWLHEIKATACGFTAVQEMT